MHRSKNAFFACVILLLLHTAVGGQNPSNGKTVSPSLRKTIDSLDKEFSKAFYDGDSVKIASFYTADAEFAGKKGRDILSAWSRSVQKSIQNDSRVLSFTTLSLEWVSDYLIEIGVAERKNSNGAVLSSGKYLVVWKNAEGAWKIHRDMGL